MRITVLVGLFTNEESAGIKIIDDVAVGIFHECSCQERNGFIECGIGVDRIQYRKLLGSTNHSVVFAKCGSEVNDAGTIVSRNKVGGNDPPTVCAGGCSEGVKRTLIAPSNKIGAFELLNDDCVIGSECRGHKQVTTSIGRRCSHIVNVGANGSGDVGDQCPWGGGPDQKVDITVDDGESHIDRWIDDFSVHVRLAEFMARQCGATSPAVGRDFVALVEKFFVP